MPRNKAVLAVVDSASVAGALLASAVLRFGWSDGLSYVQDRFPSVLFIFALFPVVSYVCGLYGTQRLRTPAAALLPAATSILVTLLLVGACWWATSSPPVGRGVTVEFALTLFAAIMTVRFAYANTRGMLKSRCLIIGSHQEAASVAALLRQHPDAALNVLGLVLCTDGRRRVDANAGEPLSAYPVLGTVDALDELVATLRVDRLILPAALGDRPALLRRLRPLRYRGVALVDLVSLYEELAREIPLDHIDEDWLFSAATTSSQVHIRRLKRVTDLVASLLLLVPAAPLLLIAALAIKLTSRGPVLFRQERVGLGSKPFMVLKLRTMYEDAEKLTGAIWSTENDPRVTSVGRMLRKFRIDELPQLFNVLRGDMSLVGPRPERPVFVQKLSDVVPFYAERLLVRPGITGWAQVMAPYAASIGDSARKLQFDLYYTKHLSFSLDLLIFLKTAKTVLFGRERVQGGMVAGQQLATMPKQTQDVTHGTFMAQPPLDAAAQVAEYAEGRAMRGEIAQA